MSYNSKFYTKQNIYIVLVAACFFQPVVMVRMSNL